MRSSDKNRDEDEGRGQLRNVVPSKTINKEAVESPPYEIHEPVCQEWRTWINYVQSSKWLLTHLTSRQN